MAESGENTFLNEQGGIGEQAKMEKRAKSEAILRRRASSSS